MKRFFKFIALVLALTSVARATYQSTVLADSPIRYWRLNETSGITATDATGNFNATYMPNSGGAWTGGTRGVSGPITSSTAITFNGSTGYISTGDVPINGLSTATFEFWTQPPATPGSYLGYFSKFVNSSNRVEIQSGGSSVLGLIISICTSSYADGLYTTAACLTAGAWNHVVVVYDGSLSGTTNRCKIYVNGALVPTTATGTIGATLPTFSTTRSSVGARIDNGPDSYLDTSVTEYAIYSTALTSSQIAAHYAASSAPPPALTVGTASVADSSATATNVSVSAATGGTSPYTYQWHRSTVSGFTPTGGTLLSGATSLSLVDSTVTADTQYFYRNIVTDAASATATSAQVSATRWSPALVIGFIGDSITDGNGGSSRPGTIAGAQLKNLRTAKSVTVVNQGIASSTTLSWAPGSGNLSNADAAFASAGVGVVSIMLGHNDSSTTNSVPASTFGTRLAAIVAHEVALGRIVILNYPVGFMAGEVGNYTVSSQALFVSYRPQISALVNGTTVRLGDTLASTFFASRPDLFADGVHPNDAGQAVLGQLWAAGIDRALNPSTGGVRAFAY